MYSSGNLSHQRGFSLLLIILAILFTSIVLFQVNSLIKNPPLVVKTAPVSQSTASIPPIDQNPTLETQKIQKYLVAESALLGVSDNISLYFKDLQNPSEISIQPTKSWIPASTIKAFVLLEAFRQKNLGLINFNQLITITSDNVVPTELETDEFPRFREGTQATIKQLVDAMITQSDNTAYNTLLDILDRRNINANLRRNGLTETVVGEKLNLDANQFQKDLKVAGRQPNTTTVKDYADFYSMLYNHQIPDAETILAILKRQKINNMIPAKLPDDTVVAHKTGDWAPIYHDGGIIYKPTDPFILVVFSNSGDPAVIAKLAQVAYYQDPKYVGKNLAIASPFTSLIANRPTFYDDQAQQVLGEATPDAKFPSVTAEDLGITSKDLLPSSTQINGVKSALLTPGSLAYNLKILTEDLQTNLSLNMTQKTNAYLNKANHRLSEVRTSLVQGNVAQSDQLLSEAIDNLKNATNTAQNSDQKDQLLVQTKNTYDLYYAVMAQIAPTLPENQESQFVDSVYDFYQKGQTNIAPVLNSAVITTPTQQKPTIGVIAQINQNQMTLKFDDGSTKQVNISNATNVRAVDQDTSQSVNNLKLGNKVAVLGPTGDNNTINAQFVLNSIPQGLTDQHQGTVTAIDPNNGIIKVIDKKGQVNLIKVDDNTSIKSTDTNVSLEGIKTGSQVVVFGISSPINSSASAQPATKPTGQNSGPTNHSATNSGQIQSTIPNQNGNTSIPKSNTNTNSQTINTGSNNPKTVTPTNPSTEIKATTVTVVSNSSGKTEKTAPNTQTAPVPEKASPNNPPPSKPAPPPATPAPAAPVPTTTKSEDKSPPKK